MVAGSSQPDDIRKAGSRPSRSLMVSFSDPSHLTRLRTIRSVDSAGGMTTVLRPGQDTRDRGPPGAP